MKKLALAIAATFTLLGGCSGSEQGSAKGSEAVQPKKALTAAEVTTAFKDQGLPIDKVEVYTAENDPNTLLGRPNQYVGKANFVDTRHPSEEADNAVEVFANVEDAKARHDYVESIAKSAPMFAQYLILSGNTLVRLEKALTPTEVEQYRAALGEAL